MRTAVWVVLGALMIGLLALPSGAAPVVKVLEDFEGDLEGWPADAKISDDAPQGARALLWRPGATPGPKFTAFNFGSRSIELVEWDRLIFEYKFADPGYNWWGVKITDYPLGDGMQATWEIARKGEIKPGEWRTAVLDLQHPKWLWGDRPDKNSQRIDFRCQFDEGKTSPILIDHIRIERDPIRIDRAEPEKPLREGDALTVIYKVTVANRTDEPAEIRLSTRDVAEGLRVTLQGDAVTVPAGSDLAVFAQLATDLVGDGAPEPLSSLSATLVAQVANTPDTEKSVTMTLPIPLEQVAHPSLLITAEQAKAVLASTENDANAKAVYDSLKARADGWLSKTPEFPDRGGQWWHWYSCKKCGARLQTKSPTEHVCPDCGAVYSGWPWDDVVLDRRHGALARAIRDLGLMYVFTGEDGYAAKAREILLGYADRYLKYPLHNINGEPKRGGGHVGPQTLDESTWLIPVVQGFDCIYDALSEEDIQQIADKMLLPAAEMIHDHQWGIHNICCWHASAYGLVGIALGDERLASDAVSGPKGFRRQIAEGVTDDGFWYESAWGYHFYTMMALQPLAIAARNIGIDLYSERYKGMYDAPLRFMAPGGLLPAFNDSGRANALGGGDRYEISYARWGDARHLLPILNSRRNSLETLLFGVELGAEEDFRLGSTLFSAAGYAILRTGDVGREKAGKHIPENYLALDYGPNGGGHGHPDKLGFVLYGKGALLAEDPGCIAYGNPAHGGWYRQTISHSTVVVDGKSQKPCTGTLQFFAPGDDVAMASARADDAYAGVRLRRTMALVGDRVIDVYLCESEEEATFDWAYHNRGAFDTGLPLAALDQAPKGDGYEWAKEWRAASAGGDWGATWVQEDGPGLVLAQAAGDVAREVLAAVGMGNPPKIKVPFVVSRTQGKQALYCSAMQVFDGEAAPELSVKVLPVSRDADDDEMPVAVEVTDGTTRDVVIVNPAGGTVSVGEYALAGQGAVLRYHGDQLAKVFAVGDGKVKVAGQAVSPGE